MSIESTDIEDSVDSTPDTSSTQETTSATPSPAPQSSPQGQPSQPKSVWDSFKNLDQFRGQDDTTIARSLYTSLQREKAATNALAQYQQYVPIAQQYLQNREPFEQFQQHREAFQQWLASQQQQRQPVAPQAQQQKKWWNPPEVRESFKQYLVKDENGREIVSPDAPLDAKHALYEYQKYKADFAQRFLTDPEGALGPMVEDKAQQIAQRIVQEQFAEVQQSQFVDSLEEEHRAWLYAEDGKTPTEEGLAAERYITEAAEMGIRSPKARWEYASKMVERDLMVRIQQLGVEEQQRGAFEAGFPQQSIPAAPPAPVAEDDEMPPFPTQPPAANVAKSGDRDKEFLRREAARNPSRSAATGDPRIPQARTFEQLLAKQLQRDGATA
jgi:hypothetical protein